MKFGSRANHPTSSSQQRRTTRTTRAAVLNNENANARPSRSVTSRVKPPSKDVGPTTRATGTTTASRAKIAAAKAAPTTSNTIDSKSDGKLDGKLDGAASKRKREALGEVTVANGKNKPTTATVNGKSKGKEVAIEKVERKVFDGVVLRARSTTTTTTTTTTVPAPAPASSTQRAPVRVFGGSATTRRTRSTAAQEKESTLDDVQEEHAEIHTRKSEMEIDASGARRASARKPPSSSVTRPSTRSTRRQPQPQPPIEEDEEEEEEDDSHVSKKRRTSSEVGDEERRQVEDELNVENDHDHTVAPGGELTLGRVEADPNGDEWDDLDAEDADDPQMVSEYVVEIFEYLKEVEVS
jgi:G2/mitotic-specific cyclin 2